MIFGDVDHTKIARIFKAILGSEEFASVWNSFVKVKKVAHPIYINGETVDLWCEDIDQYAHPRFKEFIEFLCMEYVYAANAEQNEEIEEETETRVH